MFDVHRMKIGGIRDFFPSPGTAEKIWPTLRRATPPNHATVPAHPTFDEIFPKWSLSERWKSWEKIRRIRHVSIFQMKITRVWMKIQLDGGRWCPLWPMSSSWQRKCKWISTVWWSVTYRWMCGPKKKISEKWKKSRRLLIQIPRSGSFERAGRRPFSRLWAALQGCDVMKRRIWRKKRGKIVQHMMPN